jgi:uncharacterized ferritin-like protein (DUF455 family)
MMSQEKSLFNRLYHALMLNSVEEKIKAAQNIEQEFAQGVLSITVACPPVVAIEQPGRPELPILVAPQELPKRKLGSVEGQAALIHSIAHIEFNAINLALDAAYRFRDKPHDYYIDWLRVAREEAYHFSLLQTRLQELNHVYGDFTAHNGLWEMALLTQHDFLARMAIIPRGMEAKGLDVTPGIMRRLRSIGDERTVGILEIILRDEIGHVKTGDHWFRYACQQQGLEAETVYRDLIQHYAAGQIRKPFNEEARLAAGFSARELSQLSE